MNKLTRGFVFSQAYESPIDKVALRIAYL